LQPPAREAFLRTLNSLGILQVRDLRNFEKEKSLGSRRHFRLEILQLGSYKKLGKN
jgi:hypothetical protein